MREFYKKLLSCNFLSSLSIIIFSAIVSYNLFGGPQKNMIYWIDEYFPFNPEYSFKSSFFSWNWAYYAGGIAGASGASSIQNYFYFGFIFLFHNVIGLSYGLSQYFLYVFLMSLGGIGMLIYTKKIYEHCLHSLAPLVSSLLYISSTFAVGPPTFGTMYNVFSNFIWAYMAMPLIMFFTYNAIVSLKKTFPLKEISIISFLLYFSLASITWVWLFTIVPFLFLYILFLYLIFRPKPIRVLLISLFLFCELVLLSSSLLISSQSVIPFLKENSKIAYGWMLSNSKIDPFFAIIGDTDLEFFKSTILMGIVLAIFSFSSILKKSNNIQQAHSLFFLVISLGSVTLMAGSQPPFGSIFLFLWSNFLPFKVFISLFMDFGNLLSFTYSILAPLGFFILVKKIHITKVLLCAFVLLWLFVGSSPLITGNATSWRLNPGNGVLYNNTTIPDAKVPLSIIAQDVDTAKFFQLHLHGLQERVMELPLQGPLIMTSGYLATSVIKEYGIPDISGTYGPIKDTEVYLHIAYQIYSDNTSNIANELAAFGIKYILVRLNAAPPNVFWQPWPQNPYAECKILNSTKGITYIGRIGYNAIYEVNYTYPVIYATTLPSGSTNYTSLYSFYPPPIQTGIIEWTEINPTLFKVSVINASKPFVLVLSTTYSNNWKIYGINAKHITVYSYANGWIINKTGSYQIEIFYPTTLTKVVLSLQFIGIIVPILMLSISVYLIKRANKLQH